MGGSGNRVRACRDDDCECSLCETGNSQNRFSQFFFWCSLFHDYKTTLYSLHSTCTIDLTRPHNPCMSSSEVREPPLQARGCRFETKWSFFAKVLATPRSAIAAPANATDGDTNVRTPTVASRAETKKIFTKRAFRRHRRRSKHFVIS